MNCRKLAVMVCGLFLFAGAAQAVIRVDLPVAKRFQLSDSVSIGKVTAIDEPHHLAEIAMVEQLKGDKSPATFRIQFVTPSEAIKLVKVGDPVTIMAADKASIHIADTWFAASPIKSGWRIFQQDTASAGKTFSGSTASMARILQEIKAGKSTLLDEFSGKPFSGGVKEVAKLDIGKPKFLMTADVNGDGRPDLIVGTEAGVKLFLATADGYADATEKWGLKGVAAKTASAGDLMGGGKMDLLLDGVLYLNDGQKFSAAPKVIALSSQDQVLASAFTDAGSGKHDVAFVFSDGRLVTFKNAGQTTAPWTQSVVTKLALPEPPQAAVFGDLTAEGKPGVAVVSAKSVMIFPLDAATPPADFTRLTGDLLDRIRTFGNGIKNPNVTLLDINADHRPDLLITGDGAAMVMVNRGFGAFLPDSDAGAAFSEGLAKAAPGSGSAVRATLNNASGGDDVLVLLDDGKLLLVKNSK